MLNTFLDNVDFSALPEDPPEAWVELHAQIIDLCEPNFRERKAIDRRKTIDSIIDVLQLAADTLKVEISLPIKDEFNTTLAIASIRDFGSQLKDELKREAFVDALSNRHKERAFLSDEMLEISNATLVAIHPKLQSLRTSVVSINMNEKKRAALLDLLDTFEMELNSKEISKTGSLAKIAAIGDIIVGTTTFLAEAPEALETVGQISAYIGVEIEAAEQAKQIAQEITPRAITDQTSLAE